eukprot:3717114-Pyramimonas_sp.AAC.1
MVLYDTLKLSGAHRNSESLVWSHLCLSVEALLRAAVVGNVLRRGASSYGFVVCACTRGLTCYTCNAMIHHTALTALCPTGPATVVEAFDLRKPDGFKIFQKVDPLQDCAFCYTQLVTIVQNGSLTPGWPCLRKIECLVSCAHFKSNF